MSHFDQLVRCQWSLIIIIVFSLFRSCFSLWVWYHALHAVSACYKCICISTSRISHLFPFRQIWLGVFYFNFCWSDYTVSSFVLPSLAFPSSVPFRLKNVYFDVVFIIIPNVSSQYIQTKTVCGCSQTVSVPRCPRIKINISLSSNIICLLMETLHLTFE